MLVVVVEKNELQVNPLNRYKITNLILRRTIKRHVPQIMETNTLVLWPLTKGLNVMRISGAVEVNKMVEAYFLTILSKQKINQGLCLQPAFITRTPLRARKAREELPMALF